MSITEEQVVSTEEETPTDELVETSSDDSEVSGEPAEKETEPEEDFESKVNRVAQSKADKISVKLTKQRDDIQTKLDEALSSLNEKTWDRGTAELFSENVEKLGEDVAKVKDADLKKMKAQVMEFNQKSVKVEQGIKEMETWQKERGPIERDQKAQIDLWTLVFPEDKKKIDQVNAFIKKFEKAENMDDYEIILEGIKASIKGNKKPFTPDSSKTVAGGGTDLSKLSARELLELGEKKKK